ncbi:MAG TPA: hypothetical protein H9962_09275 [Candidatus Mailhella merdigallinarum]|uniref:Uncharacterized protein n=1 Tax=Candidatus Mailhella merdigallinarum TaxID=2838658 RepID=A0A9D2KM34_9BACT|nr:hypothetical protein [Desulfovibrionaceae bacterium]HJA09361.1 hypothetical protein [Candidatus Mailhella merdigallinarum]
MKKRSRSALVAGRRECWKQSIGKIVPAASHADFFTVFFCHYVPALYPVQAGIPLFRKVGKAVELNGKRGELCAMRRPPR